MSGHHVVPFSVNIKTLSVLVFLTILTVYTAQFVDLGWFNLPLAMLIATCKAAVVGLWFMHLKYDGWMNRTIVLSAFVFLALLLGFSVIDVFFRT